ncbi:DUF6788 family protein [candidate division CSSED10-310 bacterium]|uniref:DUF6788 family protein n=1 Tax=candidate division CSSED10-310 bacterium TaxID=2855610 RepID=A0ABV6Z529_UNCC1
MEETLEVLERQRKELYKDLSKIGDFRTGTISVNYRKCGKKNCTCNQKNHPGHGPRYLWNTTIKGKSYSKHLKFGPELQKYEDEIENYHRFLALADALVKVNEKICNLKPAVELEDDNERERLKKKLQRHLSKKYKEKLIK